MRASHVVFWSLGILLWVGCGDDESSAGETTGGMKPNTGGAVAQGGGKGGRAAATGGTATGGTPAAMGGLGSSGASNEAGSGGVSEPGSGGASGLGGGVSGDGGAPTESDCLATAGAEACEARGCNPVTGVVWRLGGGAGEGGSGGSNGTCTPGGEIFVGCSLGSGGDIYACGCKVDEPTTCLRADSMLRFVTDEWVDHPNCDSCSEFF